MIPFLASPWNSRHTTSGLILRPPVHLTRKQHDTMAPRAGKARAGRAGGRRRGPEIDAPFRDLLTTATSPSTQDSRPLKRRKIAGKPRDYPVPVQQTILDDTADSDSDGDSDSDSDVEFEDVDLGPAYTDGFTAAPTETQEPLQITIENHTQPGQSKRNVARKRKPITAAEKARRLNCHKMHIVFLLYHAFFRNHWCNDTRTQACHPLLSQACYPFADSATARPSSDPSLHRD